MNQPSKYEQYIFFAVVLATLLAAVFYYHRPVAVSEEAVVRSGVAGDLLAGRAEGRQGLIGSLKWPPLPTMLILPLVKVPGFGASGLGYPILNAIISAFTLTLLNNWWASFGIPRLARYPLLGLYQASPPIIGAVILGSSATVVLLILTAGAYFLVRWLGTLDLRSLAYLGVLGGLSVITRYETIALVLLVALIILGRVGRSREKSFLAATLLTFLIPALYTLGLWFLGNWLVMSDPVFFLRGLARASVLRAELTEIDFDWPLHIMPLVLLAMTWCLRGKGVRHLLPPGTGTFSRRLEKEPVPISHIGKSVTVVIALTVLVVAAGWPYVSVRWSAVTGKSYFAGSSEQDRQVEDIMAYLAKNRPEAKVFVSGYSGYQFVSRAESPDNTFVHLMNLDPREIQHRTAGQPLLFLVPRPARLDRWEDINLQAPWLFDNYMRLPLADGELRMTFILTKAWPDWRLIEAVRLQPPQRE